MVVWIGAFLLQLGFYSCNLIFKFGLNQIWKTLTVLYISEVLIMIIALIGFLIPGYANIYYTLLFPLFYGLCHLISECCVSYTELNDNMERNPSNVYFDQIISGFWWSLLLTIGAYCLYSAVYGLYLAIAIVFSVIKIMEMTSLIRQSPQIKNVKIPIILWYFIAIISIFVLVTFISLVFSHGLSAIITAPKGQEDYKITGHRGHGLFPYME